jgi:NADPH2:quinone reductase
MKAAVLHQLGAVPRYEDFPDPVAGDGEVVVEVKAVAVENVDKAIAAGTHFATGQFLPQLPAIVGFDGIGTLPDGTLVGFGRPRPPYGAVAERTVVAMMNTVPAPAGIDPAVAVVLSSGVTGFAVKTAAGFLPGETVLVQGATGVAGRLSSRSRDCSGPAGSSLPAATMPRFARSTTSAPTP